MIDVARDIGIDVEPPEKECDDPKCPFHGSLPIRGQIFSGTVISSYERTAVVTRERLKRIGKYERFERRTTKVHAHNPPCIDARPGETVKIAECRPLSKTKSFVIIERVK